MSNQPILSGNSKVKQINDWNKIADIEKIGTKYIFKRWKTDEEIKLQETYMGLLKTLMYSYLSSLPTNSVIITIPKLMEKMYLVNHNYSYGKYNTTEVYKLMLNNKLSVEEDNIPSLTDMDKFFVSTETNYRKKIKQMLKEMEDDALISHPYEWLCFGHNDGKFTTITRATKDEYEEFLKIQTEELKNYSTRDEFGNITLKSKNELSNSEKFSFYYKVLEKAKEVFNCSFYSYEYEIIINRQGVSEHLIRNINRLEQTINDRVIDQLMKKDNYLCLIDWFINKSTQVNIKKILIENRKEENE